MKIKTNKKTQQDKKKTNETTPSKINKQNNT